MRPFVCSGAAILQGGSKSSHICIVLRKESLRVSIIAMRQSLQVQTFFRTYTRGGGGQQKILRKIKIPYWLFGVGYSGPLDASGVPAISPEIRDLLIWAKGAEGIGVRDPRTGAWLASHGVSAELIGCPVLAYPENFDGFTPGMQNPVLAVSKILLHVVGEEASKAQHLLVDRFFEEYPDGINIVQSDPDLLLLEGKQTVRDIQDIVQSLLSARFVVSVRLHSGMFALAHGRPAVILSHDSRAASFCDMLNLPIRQMTREGVTGAFDSIRAIEKGDLAEFETATQLIPQYRGKLEDYVRRMLPSTKRPKRARRLKLFLNRIMRRSIKAKKQPHFVALTKTLEKK